VSNWFAETRIDWIVESVDIFGFINRDHVKRKFWVSTPQASSDIAIVMERHPDLMVYNASTKRYELKDSDT
jgi:hypothetical protein